jgi:ABC-type sulfate/molybdate transport systems ATPase subunit
MEHGRVPQIGGPRDIYQKPATRFVADLIGTMNRLNGAVRNGVFPCRAGDLPWPGAPADVLPFEPEGGAYSSHHGHAQGHGHAHGTHAGHHHGHVHGHG